MAEDSSHSGMKARLCILDGDKVAFQAWRSKASATLDDAECLEISKGIETIPNEVTKKYDDEHRVTSRDGPVHNRRQKLPQKIKEGGYVVDATCQR